MTRRQFAFWIGLGLFGLADKLCIHSLDKLAAGLMHATEPTAPPAPPTIADAAQQLPAGVTPEHWVAMANKVWRWFEREHFIDGKWQLTGITTPIDKKTGLPYAGGSEYLDRRLVPKDVRTGDRSGREGLAAGEGAAGSAAIDGNEKEYGKPDPARRARHGRPPSKWLRSLYADEIRVWLKTIDVPEAGVSGMTYWTHLTRDHSFDADKIAGLTIPEQAKLHAAAHYGY